MQGDNSKALAAACAEANKPSAVGLFEDDWVVFWIVAHHMAAYLCASMIVIYVNVVKTLRVSAPNDRAICPPHNILSIDAIAYCARADAKELRSGFIDAPGKLQMIWRM